jgi:hypothetical protein
VTNQTSIAEGISELISRAASGGIQPVSSLAFRVTNRWSGRSTQSAIDVSRWKPSFIVGTSFSEYAVDNDALYVWTDVGFDARRGDLNGDGVVDALDRVIVQSVIDENDASPSDGDDEMASLTARTSRFMHQRAPRTLITPAPSARSTSSRS